MNAVLAVGGPATAASLPHPDQSLLDLDADYDRLEALKGDASRAVDACADAYTAAAPARIPVQ